MSGVFRASAVVTRTNIIFNSSVQRKPPEIMANKGGNFFDTKVSSRGGVMVNV